MTCRPGVPASIATVESENKMINRARSYIKAVRWQNAKTYENTAPHEYTVLKWRPELKDEFAWMVMYIRDGGVEETFWKCKYKYLYLDGYRYWSIGAPSTVTLINRCPADQPRQ